MKIDLHVHSKYSGDNLSEPDAIVEEALRKQLDGILITEHHSYEASEPWEEWIRDKKKNKGLLILRAAEVSTTSGHVIALGFKDDSWNAHYFQTGEYIELEEILFLIREIGGISIITHPYRNNMNYPLLDRFERLTGYTTVEGINAGNTKEENEKAIRILQKRGMPYTGGSDAHSARNVGKAYTVFQDRIRNLEDLMSALRSGRYTACEWNGKNK